MLLSGKERHHHLIYWRLTCVCLRRTTGDGARIRASHALITSLSISSFILARLSLSLPLPLCREGGIWEQFREVTRACVIWH